MKEESIAKINKFGKRALGFTKFIKVILIIAIAAVSIATVVVAVLPKDLLKFELNSNAKIYVDPNAVDVTLSDDNIDKIKDEVQNSTISIGENDYEQVSVVNENGKIVVTGSGDTKTVYLKDFVGPFIVVILSVVTVFVTMVFAGKLFKLIRDCETPFSEEIITALNKLAYSFIPWIFLPTIAESCMEAVFTGSTNISVGIHLETLLFVLTIFALVNIFKYGAILQQESDETL